MGDDDGAQIERPGQFRRPRRDGGEEDEEGDAKADFRHDDGDGEQALDAAARPPTGFRRHRNSAASVPRTRLISVDSAAMASELAKAATSSALSAQLAGTNRG